MISTSPKKEKEAINSLGADHFVVSKDEAQMSVRPSRCADTYQLFLLSEHMPSMSTGHQCLSQFLSNRLGT